MKSSRILSVFVILVCVVVAIILGAIFFVVPQKPKDVHAKSINFVTKSGGFEICKSNEILVDYYIVEISPSNCTFKPEFLLKRTGEKDEDALGVALGNMTISEIGSYELICRAKSGKNSYVKDRVKIKVVDEPGENTGMYISKKNPAGIYVDDSLNIDEVIHTISPIGAQLAISTSPHFVLDGQTLVAMMEGLATVDIRLSYDGITIVDQFMYTIKPRKSESANQLILTVNGTMLDNNEVQVEYSTFNQSISYYITNLYSQEVECYTDSELISIKNRYNFTTIIFTTLGRGEAIIYVSPTDFPQLRFEILIRIV